MKYLRYINEDIEKIYKTFSDDEFFLARKNKIREQFTKIELIDISKYGKVVENFQQGYKLWIFLNTKIYAHIEKFEDEWFYVFFRKYVHGSVGNTYHDDTLEDKYYECDGFDGILQLLQDNLSEKDIKIKKFFGKTKNRIFEER